MGQGREKTLQYLRESPAISDEIEKVRLIIPGMFIMYLLMHICCGLLWPSLCQEEQRPQLELGPLRVL
jgi:hypothetical protein